MCVSVSVSVSVSAFGGWAIDDECYHLLCDDLQNIHRPPLLQNVLALAGALSVLLPLEDLPAWLDGADASTAIDAAAAAAAAAASVAR